MKKRNELPNYKKISLTIDKDKILKVLEDNKDKLVQYRDSLNVKCATPYLSELYEQIPITELTEGSDYTLPLAGHRDVKYDERNYTTLVECLRGTYVDDVINMFKSPATRARFIIKKPGAHILPHMDYDTTYSVRYFIPLKTNEWSFTAVQRKDEQPVQKDIQPETKEVQPIKQEVQPEIKEEQPIDDTNKESTNLEETNEDEKK